MSSAFFAVASPQQATTATNSNSNLVLSNETKSAMSDAKSGATTFAKHLHDTAAAYDSGCKGANNSASQSRRLIPALEASAVLINDCNTFIDGALRHSSYGPEARRARNQLDRHHKEVLPRQGAAIRKCHTQLTEALGRAKLHTTI